jgi:hypothetical protein
MASRRGFVLWVGLVLLLAATLSGSASADGLPVIGVDTTANGVAGSAPNVRYLALPARGDTVVVRVERSSGRALRSRVLRGAFSVPAVAYDSTAGGLSHDGQTLVLIRPRTVFPRATTTFALLSARQLQLRGVLRLRGDFSFDAVSPRGRLLYLIQYTSPLDPTRYQVRVYDLQRRRLMAEPVVDPREAGEAMRGSPLTRATSPNGRWEYTLYDGAGKEPFVHALDLWRRTARCIDMPILSGRDLSRYRLESSRDGSTLTVRSPRRSVATVDTQSFQVTAATSRASDPGGDGRALWPLVVAVGIAAIAAIALLAVRLRRRRPLTGLSTLAPRGD